MTSQEMMKATDPVFQQPAEPNGYVSVSLRDIKIWRNEWLEDNDPQDGTDCVTPFDKYLYASQPAEPVKHKRQYAQGTALGEFGIIPMCDQVDDEPVKVPSDADILFTMRHLERHLKCIDGAIPTLLSTARALLARYGQRQEPTT